MQWSVFKFGVLSAMNLLCACAQRPSDLPRFESVSGQFSARQDLVDRPAFEIQHGGRLGDARRVELQRIACRLTHHVENDHALEINVLNTWTRNAYALSTGHIYVTLGMFDAVCREDDMAAVIAHELAHLQDPDSFVAAGFSSDQRLLVEIDADARAVVTLLDAGYDPSALIAMIDRLEPEQPAGWAQARCAHLQAVLGK